MGTTYTTRVISLAQREEKGAAKGKRNGGSGRDRKRLGLVIYPGLSVMIMSLNLII